MNEIIQLEPGATIRTSSPILNDFARPKHDITAKHRLLLQHDGKHWLLIAGETR